jgi:hypothetical protein
LSYDYMLGKGDAAMGIEGFMESAANGVIATEEALKTSITNLFPSIRWEQFAVKRPDGSEPVTWFGEPNPPGAPVFQFAPEPGGSVRLLFMRRCERSEVELVARTLGLVAFDEQTMEVFGG